MQYNLYSYFTRYFTLCAYLTQTPATTVQLMEGVGDVRAAVGERGGAGAYPDLSQLHISSGSFQLFKFTFHHSYTFWFSFLILYPIDLFFFMIPLFLFIEQLLEMFRLKVNHKCTIYAQTVILFIRFHFLLLIPHIIYIS